MRGSIWQSLMTKAVAVSGYLLITAHSTTAGSFIYMITQLQEEGVGVGRGEGLTKCKVNGGENEH